MNLQKLSAGYSGRYIIDSLFWRILMIYWKTTEWQRAYMYARTYSLAERKWLFYLAIIEDSRSWSPRYANHRRNRSPTRSILRRQWGIHGRGPGISISKPGRTKTRVNAIFKTLSTYHHVLCTTMSIRFLLMSVDRQYMQWPMTQQTTSYALQTRRHLVFVPLSPRREHRDAVLVASPSWVAVRVQVDICADLNPYTW